MASQIPNSNPTSLYPKIDDYNPQSNPTSSSSSSLYPTIDMKDLVENLFPDSYDVNPTRNHEFQPSAPPHEFQPSAPPQSIEECLVTIPGAILHLIDKNYSVELATGDLRILGLRQGDSNVAILAAVADDIQWPLTKDLASVKLDSSHYFFSFQPPSDGNEALDSSSSDEEVKKGKKSKKKEKGNEKVKEENEMLNYGLTIVGKGQDAELLKKLDWIFENYSNFSVQKVEEKVVFAGEAVTEVTVGELKKDKKKKEVVEGQCAAYWTTLAPNVEEYSGTAAKLIAAGSGQLVKGVLWCGDVTMDRLKWGNEVMMKRMSPSENDKKIDPSTLRRIKRVKRVTKMTEKVATGVLTGVVKVSGYFTGSVANSKVGKKFFNLLPGEIVLASLDGFSKICDAVEVAGKNVMSTSSTVTTGLVSHKYGEEAAKATNEGMDAAGHAIGTAWAVFKIRKALNPKSVLKPSTLAKSAAKAALAGKKAK